MPGTICGEKCGDSGMVLLLVGGIATKSARKLRCDRETSRALACQARSVFMDDITTVIPSKPTMASSHCSAQGHAA
ncbi:MAG: hypothetical protein PSY12_00370 [bacterium]|nr:hypothetical protein [bacterium]